MLIGKTDISCGENSIIVIKNKQKLSVFTAKWQNHETFTDISSCFSVAYWRQSLFPFIFRLKHSCIVNVLFCFLLLKVCEDSNTRKPPPYWRNSDCLQIFHENLKIVFFWFSFLLYIPMCIYSEAKNIFVYLYFMILIITKRHSRCDDIHLQAEWEESVLCRSSLSTFCLSATFNCWPLTERYRIHR